MKTPRDLANRMLAAENIEHELGSIACPTLVTAGRGDLGR